MLAKPVSLQALQNKHVDKSIPKAVLQPGQAPWLGAAAVVVQGCHR